MVKTSETTEKRRPTLDILAGTGLSDNDCVDLGPLGLCSQSHCSKERSEKILTLRQCVHDGGQQQI